eukprot:718402-Pelagomonas_calceolata.AAC.4
MVRYRAAEASIMLAALGMDASVETPVCSKSNGSRSSFGIIIPCTRVCTWPRPTLVLLASASLHCVTQSIGKQAPQGDLAREAGISSPCMGMWLQATERTKTSAAMHP